jgi:hypothetical protein
LKVQGNLVLNSEAGNKFEIFTKIASSASISRRSYEMWRLMPGLMADDDHGDDDDDDAYA